MLPDSDDHPPSLCQPPVGIRVSGPVAFHLCGPVLGISCSPGTTVLWAAMPEAAIDIHDHPRWTEHDVRTSAQSLQRRSIHPVPESVCVEITPDRQFWCSIPGPLHLHTTSDTGRARIRSFLRLRAAGARAYRWPATRRLPHHMFIVRCPSSDFSMDPKSVSTSAAAA